MSAPAPERVFPASPPASSPAGGGVTGKVRGSFSGTRNKLLWAGAGVVAVVALIAGRGGAPDSDPDASGAELDSSANDGYNELQSQIESVGDQLDDLRDDPKWQQPAPVTTGTPHANNSGPKGGNGGPKAVRKTYRVKNGDTLASVAKDLKVKGGQARLYAVNRNIIKRAATEHKEKNPGTTRKLFPGTILVIPGG